MGENKQLRNRIRGLSIPLQEHLEKIALERSKLNPDEGLIHHERRRYEHGNKKFNDLRNA